MVLHKNLLIFLIDDCYDFAVKFYMEKYISHPYKQ